MQGLIPGEGLQSGGGVLHRKVTEKLNSLKELAGRQVERADRIERAGRAQVRLFFSFESVLVAQRSVDWIGI